MIEGRPERIDAGAWGRGPTLVLWFGAFGAPAAWVVQLLAGYAFEEAACSSGSSGWGVDASAAHALLFAGCAAVAVAAGIASFRSLRAAGRPESGDVRGRLAFTALAGLLASVLFLALICVTGVGSVVLDPCARG